MMTKWIAMAGLIGAGLVSTAAAQAVRDDAASEALGIKLSLQCWTYNRLTTYEAIDRAKQYGIRYLEMYPGQRLRPDADFKNGPGLPAEERDALLKKLADSGVKAVSFGVDGLPGDEAGLRARFAWARDMGIQNINTETRPTALMSTLADEYGINVCIHNHPKTWPADQVLDAVKDLGPRVGACGDSGHWQRAGKVPVENLKLLKGRMRSMHLKDLNEKNEDVVFGEGRGDVKGQLAELKAQGFKGFLSIEYERNQGDLNHVDAAVSGSVAAFDRLCAEVAK